MEKWWLFIVKSCFLCVVEIPEVGSGEVQSCIVCLSVCLSVYVAFREAPKKLLGKPLFPKSRNVGELSEAASQ